MKRVKLKQSIDRWVDESVDESIHKRLREVREEFGYPSEDTNPETEEFEFEPPSQEEKLKWFDRSGKSPEELKELANGPRKDVDYESYTVKAVRTNYIEFKIDEPTGMSKACECLDCSLEFYITPFSTAVECPSCHGSNVTSEPNIKQ